MIRQGKRLLATAIYHSGAWRALHRPNRIPVLLYHRVCPIRLADQNLPGMYVTDATFRMHLAFLKRHFRMIGPAEFHDRIDLGGTGQEEMPACLLTFDDGWRSVYDHAWPALRDSDAPALVFLITDTFHGKEPSGYHFLDLMERVNMLPPRERAAAGELAALLAIRADAGGAWSGTRREQCLARYKVAPPAVQRELDRRAAGVLPPTDGAFLTMVQTGIMGDSGLVFFGSHTCSHALLDQIPSLAGWRELHESFRVLAGGIPGFFPSLAYPNGNCDRAISRLAAKAGYRLGFTTRPGGARPGGDSMRLPRIAVHEDIAGRIPLFVCRLMGVPGF
jgi:peptidoglycan/xylan/chitin deacetylase (PgdA/CDA1 family)